MIRYNQANEDDILSHFIELRNDLIYASKFVEENNDLISKRNKYIRKYIVQSSQKMAEFALSIYILMENESISFPYEAKIIARSMFEHLFDFMYIFYEDESTKKILPESTSLIKRFYDYQKRCTFFYKHYEVLDKLANETSLSDIQNKHLKQLKKLNRKINFRTKINTYKNKYHTNEIKNWRGFGISKSIYDFCGHLTSIYQKLYSTYCTYTHVAYLKEFNEKNPFGFNVEKCEEIDAYYYLNLIYTIYLKMLYNLTLQKGISSKKLKNYIEKFEAIETKYNIGCI